MQSTPARGHRRAPIKTGQAIVKFVIALHFRVAATVDSVLSALLKTLKQFCFKLNRLEIKIKSL